MAWIPFTVNDVPVRADVREQVTAAAARGDLMPAIVSGVIRQITGRVAVRNPVGVEGTIPEELWEAARAIAAFRFLTEGDSDELLTKARIDAKDDALQLLDAVAAGTLKIVAPENFAPVQAKSPSPRVNARSPRYNPEKFDGV